MGIDLVLYMKNIYISKMDKKKDEDRLMEMD